MLTFDCSFNSCNKKATISKNRTKKGEFISDEDILNLLLNMIKQRKESVDIPEAGEDLKKENKKNRNN